MRVDGQKPSASQVYFHNGGLQLVADACGDPRNPPVFFLHGGGQTRASWGRALVEIAESGFYTLTLDLRGHGDSQWAPDGNYDIGQYAEDLKRVLGEFGRPSYLVGASLGGLTGLLAAADIGACVSGLILVDVTPRVEIAGSTRIQSFMRQNPNGFASIEEAAETVAAYLPHRARPKDTSGLSKNLRLREGGRYYWHWDPAFIKYNEDLDLRAFTARLNAAASKIRVPTLLLRGALSDVVSDEGVSEFLSRVPHAEYVDIADADHMIAGDRNDAFNEAVRAFLVRHRENPRNAPLSEMRQ